MALLFATQDFCVIFFSKMAKGSTFLAHNQIGQCETTISLKNCEAVFRFARINQW